MHRKRTPDDYHLDRVKPRGTEILLGILDVSVCRQLLQILTLFQSRNVISHTRFQTKSIEVVVVVKHSPLKNLDVKGS